MTAGILCDPDPWATGLPSGLGRRAGSFHFIVSGNWMYYYPSSDPPLERLMRHASVTLYRLALVLSCWLAQVSASLAAGSPAITKAPPAPARWQLVLPWAYSGQFGPGLQILANGEIMAVAYDSTPPSHLDLVRIDTDGRILERAAQPSSAPVGTFALPRHQFLVGGREVFRIGPLGQLAWRTPVQYGVVTAALVTSDGGFLVGGPDPDEGEPFTTPVGAARPVPLPTPSDVRGPASLNRLDRDGHLEWAASYMDRIGQASPAIVPAPLGGSYLVGHSKVDYAPRVLRIDALGTVVWQVDFTDVDGFRLLASAPGQELLLTSKAAVTRVDAAGRVRWRRRFTSWPDSDFTTLVPVEDGWILAGQTPGQSWQGDVDVLVIRLAFDGSVRWARTYGTPDAIDRLEVLRRAPDGGFWFAGESAASDLEVGRLVVIRARADGTERWRRTYPELGYAGAGHVLPGPEDGVIVIGSAADIPTAWPLHPYRGFGLSIDGAGTERWRHDYSVGGEESFYCCDAALGTPDGGFILSASTSLPYQSRLLVKTDADGHTGPCIDQDRDGTTSCAGDCNDLDRLIGPGHTEIPGNGVDDDCDGLTPDEPSSPK